MNFSILQPNEFYLYYDHVRKNCKNTRVEDYNLLLKIKEGLEADDGKVVIFVEKDNNGNIVNSILTRKRRLNFEYIIINYRTSGTKYFSKKTFFNLFDYVFLYYENIGYYRWLLIRPVDLLNQKFFKNLGDTHPFNRYETAIECIPANVPINDTIYQLDLISGIPSSLDLKDFIIIAGFCKQIYRTNLQFNHPNFI